jgi:hypothetical protein
MPSMGLWLFGLSSLLGVAILLVVKLRLGSSWQEWEVLLNAPVAKRKTRRRFRALGPEDGGDGGTPGAASPTADLTSRSGRRGRWFWLQRP